MFMDSTEYNYAPKDFPNTWPKNSDRNIGHVLCNENDFVLPIPRIELFKENPYFVTSCC